jgi:poly(3-hydroxybutyrate) depolymerase
MEYRIQLPPQPPAPAGYRLWLFLHGAFATADQGPAVFGELAAAQGAVLLSPQATRPCGDGYCWSFAHDAGAIRRLLDQTVAAQPIDRQKIGLIGYSMGCTMGLWLLAQNPATFVAFAALGMGSAFEPWEHDDGGVDRAGLRQSAEATRVLLAVDQLDPAGTSQYFAANLAELRAAGFAVTTLRPAEATHAITEAMRAAAVEHLGA